MNRGFVFILILAVGLVVTSCLRQGKQNVTYDFTPLDSIISTWMDKGYYPCLLYTSPSPRALPACSPGGQLQSFGFGCHRDIAFGYCFCTGNSI